MDYSYGHINYAKRSYVERYQFYSHKSEQRPTTAKEANIHPAQCNANVNDDKEESCRQKQPLQFRLSLLLVFFGRRNQQFIYRRFGVFYRHETEKSDRTNRVPRHTWIVCIDKLRHSMQS